MKRITVSLKIDEWSVSYAAKGNSSQSADSATTILMNRVNKTERTVIFFFTGDRLPYKRNERRREKRVWEERTENREREEREEKGCERWYVAWVMRSGLGGNRLVGVGGLKFVKRLIKERPLLYGVVQSSKFYVYHVCTTCPCHTRSIVNLFRKRQKTLQAWRRLTECSVGELGVGVEYLLFKSLFVFV